MKNPLKSGTASPYFRTRMPNVEVKVGSIVGVEIPEIANPEGYPYSLGFSQQSDDVSAFCSLNKPVHFSSLVFNP